MMSIDTIGFIIIGAMNLATAILALRSHNVATATQADVKKIEVATNSMKDALVHSTAEASLAQGRVEGIASAEAKAADVAKGKALGHD